MTTIARFTAALVLVTVAATQQARGQQDETAPLEPVRVSASPAGEALAGSFQSVTVIDRERIAAWPAATLADVLAGVAGVDVQRRGGPGVQADIGIRGTGFEQTVILLDGLPMGDPQTGHHNLNLPVPIDHIERIEVVKGPGALAYGGHATGGVINIVTRTGATGPNVASARVGSHDTRAGALSLGGRLASSGHRLSAETLRTDGHLPLGRADAELERGLYTGRSELGEARLRWGFGAENRSFGAWKFYSAAFPDQRERTRTRSAWLGADARLGGWIVTPGVWWRRHDDWFRTLVGETAFINEHATRLQGARLSARTRRGRAVSAVGASFQHERIDSNALDDHDRDQAQAWLVHRRPLDELTAIEAGLAAVDFSDYSRYLLPSLAVRHAVARRWTAFASLARTAREPSYTERFLQTSANVGNPSLAPERSTYAEAGLRWRAGSYALDLALFERRTDDLVDWARPPGEVTWQADNFDGHRSRGAEIEWRWRPDAGAIEHVDLAVTALDTELDARGLEIKYALDYPERSLKGGAVWRFGERFRLTTRARYQDRSSGESAVLVDARASWRVSRAELFVAGTNLLDETVVEAGFAPLPGRWLYAGLRLDY